MALLTFPREFPLDGCFTDACTFDLVPVQETSLSGTASLDVMGVAPSYFLGKWSTRVLSREEFGIWDAWLNSLRGGLRSFKGRPNRARWPMSRPRGFEGMLFGGVQWSGIGRLADIGVSRDEVTIDQIPNGLLLQPGDWFSIPVGARQRIHQVMTIGTSSGNAVTVACEPPIVPGVVTGIAVRLDTPYCDMTLVGKPDRPKNPTRGGSISFTGHQKLI